MADTHLKVSNKLTAAFLNLGGSGVRLTFDNAGFSEEAFSHILLSETFENQIIGEINYIEDDSVSGLIRTPCKPNVVYIERKEPGPDHVKMLLRMFDLYTVSFDIKKSRTTVRYPSDMPSHYLLDDVLQAALQPILERIGGFILHGSCMVRGNNAIVLMGRSGSGKSTTAFNLTRFGFHCYADDAVLVTPGESEMHVWPLDRDLSLRPLSFRLFQDQDIGLDEYKKEGGKYYFLQKNGPGDGAVLKYICFVEVTGEHKTDIAKLSSDESLKILSQEERHFSFMGRGKAARFAKALADNVPFSLYAQVGLDLDEQGRALDAVFSGKELPVIKERKNMNGRSEKLSIIRNAWSFPGREPLDELLPLLGDPDLKVFTAALAFFQNYPLSRMEAISMPVADCAMLKRSPTSAMPAAWLRTGDWTAGCRKLISRSRKEVLEQYAFSWIKSAPVLYPFLKALSNNDPDKSRILGLARERFNQERSGKNTIGSVNMMYPFPVQTLDPQKNLLLLTPDAGAGLPRYITEAGEGLHIYYWFSQDSGEKWSVFIDGLKRTGVSAHITVVPAVNDEKDTLSAAVDFVKKANSCGLRPRVSRMIPLCRLTDDDALFILESDALETAIADAGERVLHITAEDTLHHALQQWRPEQDLSEGDRLRLVRGPYRECEECIVNALGLCAGGYFIR